jgi:hypothetical protein
MKDDDNNNNERSDDCEEEEDPFHELKNQWQSFKEALYSVEAFDQWHWIYVLFRASVHYAVFVVKQKLLLRVPCCVKKWWKLVYRQVIPCFAIGLVASMLSLYVFVLRNQVLLPRWCSPTAAARDHHDIRNSTNNSTRNITSSTTTTTCRWAYFHDTLVTYFGVMILWNYFITVFSSPGVALPSTVTAPQQNHPTTATIRDDNLEECVVWKSAESRGGCCFINPLPVNIELELSRVQRFIPPTKTLSPTNSAGETITDAQQEMSEPSTNKANSGILLYFPPLECSSCERCHINNRPPRCHHCSTCNRCVLQMDHHCIWMNTCIGYANYRSFLLTLVYIMLACFYGTFVLLLPFGELLQEQIAKYGFWTSLWNLRIPPLWVLITQAINSISNNNRVSTQGLLDGDIAIKIAFPFLLGVSLTMMVFLLVHLRLLAQGITTLERIIQLDKMKSILLSTANGKDPKVVINPYNQGFLRNVYQVFGKNFLSVLIPIYVEPLHPYFPRQLGEYKKNI